VRFVDLAEASRRLASTRSRNEKTRTLVEVLSSVEPGEIAAAVGWLVAEPTSGPLGVGPALLWGMSRSAPPVEPTLELAEVERILHGAAKAEAGREAALSSVAELFARLTETERAFFTGSLTGSLRQGSLGGVMQKAIAELARVDEVVVRRAVTLRGSVVQAAAALLGPERSAPSTIELFHPMAPMLASPADTVEEARSALGKADAVVEWKIDGVRAQIHKQGDRVAVFSRQGHDITEGCAPVAPALRSLSATQAVLDGEVALVGHDGKIRPFQDSFSALASRGVGAEGDRLQIWLFDCLHRDGVDLLDAPLSERLEALRAIAPLSMCVPQAPCPDAQQAGAFLAEALSAGHEGVMMKDLSAPYQLGGRGRAWQKVKQHATVDLVVLAVEWGSGRRKGLLSNLHLGARRADGSFCMVGKTFKGLTDAMLRWQTDRLKELEVESWSYGIRVRPELVVEIRFNDVQRSPRYPGGIALRFARVVRHRPDKSASEVEPLESLLRRLPPGQAPPDPGATARKRQLGLFD
jgi:DNA ligase-1